MDGPHVVVDVDQVDGLLWISLVNLGDEPAHDISVRFSRKVIGIGATAYHTLELFRDVGFLAPGRGHRVVLDRTGDHLRTLRERGVDPDFTATTTFHDDRGRAHTSTARHNLAIYDVYPTTPEA